MNNKTKPVSRLTLVFILAVVISGSILTWFSINNIANLKELTEKRIIEEQRELADHFSSEIQKRLENSTSIYRNEIAPEDQLREELIKTTRGYDYFSMPYILNNKGQFLFPNFKESFDENTKEVSTARFSSTFAEAEKAEFNQINLINARSLYSKCLRYSNNSTDSLKALNALGRTAVKLGRKKDALTYYKSIILKCGKHTNNGFPYIYYVIPQLVKIYSPECSSEIKVLVNTCLEKMVIGLVPLNLFTQEVLREITILADTHKTEENNEFRQIEALVAAVNKQLELVANLKKTAFYAFNGDIPTNQTEAVNGFSFITTFTSDEPGVLLVKTDQNYSYGFVLDCSKLFDVILQNELQNDMEFDHLLQTSEEYNVTSSQSRLIYQAQVNPMFSNQYVQIRLKDENLIEELVKTRSWIYGIASVLLIVAMFLGVFLTLRDISREKHLARLRADFISNVTHELKTPLTSIYMFAESLQLKRVKSSEDKREYLGIIIKESERLKRMINNILEFSKMDKGKSDVHLVKANLTETIESAIKDLDYWLEKEQFKVTEDLEEDITMEYDPEKMKQALSNLISNAIKYSGETKEITVRMHCNSRGIVIDVEDKGIGIPEDKQNHIFDKFYRIEQKENTSGTGLGLTVVKEIVEAHNGRITVSSIPGEGSKFSIHLYH